MSTTTQQDIMAARRALPMYLYKDRFLKTFAKSRTTIVVGETGSGKTTQIPQFLHEAGYTEDGLVAITQPRRVAAITVAKRVADEMSVSLGNEVGYAIRFDDTTSARTRVKFLTDGMLLREALLHPLLEPYSVVVLDEAHERTLQTDVLFAVVKRALRERDDLRVVVMSATLDVGLFTSFFPDATALHVPGRTHPVRTLYTLEPETDYVDAAILTVMQIHEEEPAGDVLVFLTGQEEIESAEELLTDRAARLPASARPLVVCPIYAALPPEQQLRAFAPPPRGARKVVLATNIAESSITISGVRYVVDPGVAKVRTYDPRSGREALLVTPISKAQAWQRAGRAGREAPGKCFRVMTETAFESLRPAPVPEVQRVSLESVVLTLKGMGVDDVLGFDFVEPPSRAALRQALVHLTRLGALSGRTLKLTKLGRQMTSLPLSPSLSLLLLASPALHCVSEALTLVAMLSVENVFISPREAREDAGAAHARFAADGSDHVTLVNAFDAYRDAGRDRDWCRRNFLNSRNLYQAARVRKQLADLMPRLKIDPSETSWPDSTPLRKCILRGCFLSLAQAIPQSSTGAHAKFRTLTARVEAGAHPTSVLFRQGNTPPFVVFSELVETRRTYLRTVTAIQESWIDEVLPGLFTHKVESVDTTAQDRKRPRNGKAATPSRPERKARPVRATTSTAASVLERVKEARARRRHAAAP